MLGEVHGTPGVSQYSYLDALFLPGQSYVYRVEGLTPSGSAVISQGVVSQSLAASARPAGDLNGQPPGRLPGSQPGAELGWQPDQAACCPPSPAKRPYTHHLVSSDKFITIVLV